VVTIARELSCLILTICSLLPYNGMLGCFDPQFVCLDQQDRYFAQHQYGEAIWKTTEQSCLTGRKGSEWR
jgi:hypothetical protein